MASNKDHLMEKKLTSVTMFKLFEICFVHVQLSFYIMGIGKVEIIHKFSKELLGRIEKEASIALDKTLGRLKT